MDDIDVWRSANQMIKRFGTDASVRAAMRADVLFDLGDIAGYRVWKRVVDAINELNRRTRDGDALN
jgi:hypothetical protein